MFMTMTVPNGSENPNKDIQAYDEALKINPNDVVVLTKKGIALAAFGKYADY